MEYTALEVITKYFEIDDFIEHEDKAHKIRMAPYLEAIETLRNAAALLAEQTQQSSLSTEIGTAFPVSQKRVKCVDKAAMIAWIMENHRDEFLTAHVSKDAVIQFYEQRKEALDKKMDEGSEVCPTDLSLLPPGVEMEEFKQWQFRRK
jgi:hypothetical protein